MRLALRAQKSIDLICSTMTNPVTSGSFTTATWKGKPRMFVKHGVTHNQSRPAASLLMARLRVEGDGNEVAFSWNVGFHLPGLSADWFSPIHFPGLIVLRDA